MIKSIKLISSIFILFLFFQSTQAQDGVRYSSYNKTTQDKVYRMSEVAPVPVVGLVDFYEDTKYNIRKALRNSGQKANGAVYVRFIVEKDGSLSDVHVVKGIGGCDTEVVQCIRNAKWKPGRQAGKPVRVQKTISIRLN